MKITFFSAIFLIACTSTARAQIDKTGTAKLTVQGTYEKMKLQLPFDTEAREYWVQKVGHYYVLNDDIWVGDDRLSHVMSYGSNNKDYLWHNAEIPVVIDPSIFEKNLHGAVYRAIEEINGKSELCIVPYTNQDDYVAIVYSSTIGGAGLSAVGRQGGRQELLLNDGASFGNIAHEFLHAAGLYHEQSRNDRDQFVRIVERNVRPNAMNNFQKEPGTAFGAYDYCSIMHYGPMAFSQSGTATIECLSGGVSTPCPPCMGRRDSLSRLDIAGIDRLYTSVSRFPCNTHYPRMSDPRSNAEVAAVSATKGGVTLFTVGNDGGVWSSYYDPRVANPQWTDWFPLGGKVLPGANVSAVSTVEGGVSLFTVGMDGAVWSAYYDPRVAKPQWTEWFSLGGKVRPGSNVSAVSATPGGVSLFTVGLDGAVWSAYYDPRVANPKWSSWFSLGAQLLPGTDVTSVSTMEGGVSLFGVGMDGAVWSAYFDPRLPDAKWSGWFSLGGKVRKGTSVSAVSATRGGVSLFVTGTDDVVHSNYYDPRVANPKWSNWFSLGGKLLAGTQVSAISSIEGSISLFGIGMDGGVWSAYFDSRIANAKWTSWFPLGTARQVRGRSNVRAVSHLPGGISLFAISADSRVQSSYFDPREAGAKWSNWFFIP